MWSDNPPGLRPRLTALLVVVLAGQAAASIGIKSSSPASPATVSLGSTTTLTCSTTVPWYLCVWEGPGGMACQCQTQVGGVNSMCAGYPRVKLTGGATECSATISGVVAEDAGTWRCVLADATDFNTVSRRIEVEVGRAAVVAWAGLGSSLSLGEGEEREVVCEARGGWPEAQITVTGSNHLQKRRPESSPTGNGLVDVSQTFVYTGNMEDNNRPLVCVAEQFDKGGALLYTSTVEVGLAISEAEVAGLAIPIGGIIGIILAILFLFLLCGILACCFFCPIWCCVGMLGKRRQGGAVLKNQPSDSESEKFIVAEKIDSIPRVHEGYVSREAEMKNYDSNLSLNFNIIGNKSEAYVSSEKLEKLIDGESDRGSSSSSSDLKKVPEIEKAGFEKQDSEHETAFLFVKPANHGKKEKNQQQKQSWNVSQTISSIEKHDTTIIINGKPYEEESFEKHLEQKGASDRAWQEKRLKNKWKNNLIEIQEGDGTSGGSRSTNSDDDKEEVNSHITKKGILKRKDSDRSVHFCCDDNLSSSEKTRCENIPGKHYQQYLHGTATEVLVRTENEKNTQEMLRQRRLEKEQQRLQQAGNTGKRGDKNSSSGASSTTKTKSNYTQENIIVYSDESSSTAAKKDLDEHYYIGDSEYAEVVQEHVQGKYEDDLSYYEKKTKEVIEVNTKLLTIEELRLMEEYLEEESYQRQGARKAGTKINVIPPVNEYDERSKLAKLLEPEVELVRPSLLNEVQTSNQYAASWVERENLELSPDSDVSRGSFPLFKASDSESKEELDRSDESCVVEVERRGRKMSEGSNSTASSSAKNIYKHMADYVRTKEQVSKANLLKQNQFKKVESPVKPTESRFSQQPQARKAETLHRIEREKQIDEKTMISLNAKQQTQRAYKRSENGQMPGKPSGSAVAVEKNNVKTAGHKQYKITQQEIIFYLKNTDGVLKIVRRPLMHTKGKRIEVRRSSSSEGRGGLKRHLSQPNLHGTHILRHVEDATETHNVKIQMERYENVQEWESQETSGSSENLDHLQNVGVIHNSTPNNNHLSQVLGLNGEWRSSGSIFDCEMNCFESGQPAQTGYHSSQPLGKPARSQQPPGQSKTTTSSSPQFPHVKSRPPRPPTSHNSTVFI